MGFNRKPYLKSYGRRKVGTLAKDVVVAFDHIELQALYIKILGWAVTVECGLIVYLLKLIFEGRLK
jgi:hypothetical protein